MLRPRTFLRLVLYVFLTWLVLGLLYVGIPSFSRVDDGVEYATSVLTSGGKLTRVYGYHYFPSDVVEFTSNNEARDHLVLTFKIDKASDSLVICDTGKVPLTRQKQDEGSDDESVISLSVSAPAGDTDGISLPWFDTADAVMMYHFIDHDEALVKLNVGFGENGRKLDVWPAGNDRDNKNLLSLTLDNAESDGASRVLTASVPHPPLSSSPSPTYHIRLVLLMFLAPLTILLSGVYMGLVSLVSTVVGLFFRVFWVFAFLFVVRWVHKGRPPVGEFIQEVGDDARSLAERVRTWRSGRSSNRGKDEEQPPLSDEQVKSDPEIERKDVS